MNLKPLINIIVTTGVAIVILFFFPTTVLANNYITPGEVLSPQILIESGLGNTDFRIVIARLIRTAMSLLGIIAVVVVLLGGFTWMTAGGNEEKVGEAKKLLYSGVIGLAIVLSAYSIANFAINQLVNATTTPGPTIL